MFNGKREELDMLAYDKLNCLLERGSFTLEFEVVGSILDEKVLVSVIHHLVTPCTA